MMKKFFQYILIIVFLSLGGIILVNKFEPRGYFQGTLDLIKPCSSPLAYSIGSIDPRFGITQEDFLKTIGEAEKVWEDPVSKNLMEYNPSAEFKINLVYDSRQEETATSREMEGQLGQLESSHDDIMKEYDSLSAVYKKRINAYDAAVAEYKKDLAKYNDSVAEWNSSDGLSQDKYDELKKDKKDLNKRFDELEKERIVINNLAGKTNTLVQKSNQIANTYNRNLSTYKDRFGGSVQFDKGIYSGNKIDIYQFYEIGDLRLTLAHELGHALEIDHLNDPQSVMYYLMGDQNMDQPKATEEDINALKDVCKIN